jgi:hypothetical protein
MRLILIKMTKKSLFDRYLCRNIVVVIREGDVDVNSKRVGTMVVLVSQIRSG